MLLGTHPVEQATDVHVSSSIHLRFSLAMDAATLKRLRLLQRIDDQDVEVEVQYSTDLTHASITVSPRQFLEPNTDYVLTGDAEVRSRAGDRLQLFRLRFQTGNQAVASGNGLVFTVTTVEKLRTPSGKLQLSGPLDITQDVHTGNLYIADFGKQSKFGADGSLVLLRPARSAQ